MGVGSPGSELASWVFSLDDGLAGFPLDGCVGFALAVDSGVVVERFCGGGLVVDGWSDSRCGLVGFVLLRVCRVDDVAASTGEPFLFAMVAICWM